MSVNEIEEQVSKEILELKLNRKKKIQNDRGKLIDRMSSRREPFPVGAFEGLSQLNIWKNVLEYLDPASLASAYSCCSTFKLYCEESLLVHVFSALKDKGWLYLKRMQKDDPLHESRRLNNHAIWELRLVSKSWKRVTEQVHFNEFRDPSWYVNYPHVLPVRTHPVYITRFEGIAQSADILESSDSRAMLCQLFFLSSGNHLNWFHATLKLLRMHGSHIRGAYIMIPSIWESLEDKYAILWHYLKWLPNIKWLIVNNDYDLASASDLNKDNDQLRTKIHKSPLPTIQSLTMIQFVNYYENELLLNEVLRANPHIKSLQLPRKTLVTAPVKLQMEKLTGLAEYRIRAESEEGVTQLTAVLPDTKWPLKHLTIGFVYGFIFGTVDELFSLINRFGPTLETLGWSLHPSKVELHHRLELPRLRSISFNLFSWHPAIGLDFLLPCRSLEQIHFVDISTEGYSGSSEGSVLIGYENTVQESNFWKWFPRLVCVRIEEYVGYTQEEKRAPEHFVRKGSDVVKLPAALNCEIDCKKYKYI